MAALFIQFTSDVVSGHGDFWSAVRIVDVGGKVPGSGSTWLSEPYHTRCLKQAASTNELIAD